MTKMTEEIRAVLVRGKVGLGRSYPEAARDAVMDLVTLQRRARCEAPVGPLVCHRTAA
jgi:hypothetical protein